MTTGRKTILCVDDDRDDQFLIRESIRRIADIHIECAYNGKEALDILRQRKISNHLPSLIITDINMPTMDGNKMLRTIRNDDAFKEIPIVIFTTSTATVDRQYLHRGDVKIIAKPTDWASYEAIAKTILSCLSLPA
jgi:CheY-like chemotaxis protein